MASDFDRLLSDLALEGDPNAEQLRRIRDQGERSGSEQVSPAGAKGIYQFMDKTGGQYGLKDPTDPVASTKAASKFVQDLHSEYRRKYPGKSEQEYEQIVNAHYNGGYKQANAVAQGRIAPAQETRDYLKRVEGTTDFDRLMSDLEVEKKTTIEVPKEKLNTRKLEQLANPSWSEKAKQYGKDFVGGAKVSADAITRAITAGAYDPKLSTKDERSKYAGADIVGNLAGTAPYAFIPGGLAVQAPLMAGRAATQTLVEGGSGKEAAISGALEGAAGPVGKIAGAVVKGGAKLASKAASPVVNVIVRPAAMSVDQKTLQAFNRAKSNQSFEELPQLGATLFRQKLPDDVFNVLAGQDTLANKLRQVAPQYKADAEVIDAARKRANIRGQTLTKDNLENFLKESDLISHPFETIGQAGVKQVGENVLRDVGSISLTGAGVGALTGAASGGDPITGAVVGAGLGAGGVLAIKASLLRNALTAAPEWQKGLLKVLPESVGNREAFVEAARKSAQDAINKGAPKPKNFDSVLDDFGEQAGRLYDDAMRNQFSGMQKATQKTVGGASLIGSKAAEEGLRRLDERRSSGGSR